MKTIFTAAFGLYGIIAFAQSTPYEYEGRVGINTVTPRASLEIKKHTEISETSPQGVLFPKLTNDERDKFINTEVGTLIYNIDNQCIEMYMGFVGGIHLWNCISDIGSNQQQNVMVVPMGFEGVYIDGVTLNNSNKVKFKLINNSFSPINNIDFSTAVSISNNSGNINVLPNQNKNVSLVSGEEKILHYTLSGVPENGILRAFFDRLNLHSSQQTLVGMGTATLSDNTTSIVRVSLTHKGFDVQGKIDNNVNSLRIKIPYTNGIGSYNAISHTITTNPIYGQNNDTNELTLNIPAGTFNGDDELIADINVGGDGEYLIKLLQPEETITFAEFPITINGTAHTVVLKAIGGVPDKMFGEMTNGVYEHQFVYVPITINGSGTWLNNNLGADYSNVNSPYFSPLTQAGGDSKIPNVIKSDYRAYGSFFQWGRPADGHELNNWVSSTQYTRRRPHMGYMPSTQLINYTDPCPIGYHTPSYIELMQLQDVLTGKTTPFNVDTNSPALWNDLILRLPAVGNVGIDGLLDPSRLGRYRSKTLRSDFKTPYLWFSNRGSDVDTGAVRADLLPIRCLKD